MKQFRSVPGSASRVRAWAVAALLLAACAPGGRTPAAGPGPHPDSPGSSAAAPVIFFTDLTDGPRRGWNGSATKGAAVSVWGLHLGSRRGDSYVTVGGVDLTADGDYAEWGATTNPKTARGLERVTFWLNASVPLGGQTVTVTVDGRTSNPLPFYVRDTGNIYFVSPDGSDDDPGTLAEPWRTFGKVRLEARAGDVVYFREGLYAEEDPYSQASKRAVLKLYDFEDCPEYCFADGEAHRSIALASFPGEVARIGNGAVGLDFFVYRYDDESGARRPELLDVQQVPDPYPQPQLCLERSHQRQQGQGFAHRRKRHDLGVPRTR